MAITKDTLVDALRLRYDSYSAETVFELACTRAGLEGKSSFEGKEVAAFRAALEKVGDRVGNVLARIDDLAGTAPAKPEAAKSDGKPEAKAETQPDSKPHEAKSDGKPEVKADAKSDKHSDAKSDKHAAGKHHDAKSDKHHDAKSDKHHDAKSDKHDAKAKGDDKPVETTIVLRGVDAKDGEQILVCGALSELGDWDPERARPMTRDGEQWLTTFKLAPDSEISFKLLRKNAAGAITWEAGDNRQVRASQRLDVTWRTA